MNRVTSFILCAIGTLFFGMAPLFASDHSDKVKPKWITHSLPESVSGTYIFVAAHGSGSSMEAARQSAMLNLTNRLETEHGLVINSSFHSVTRSTTTTNGIKGSRDSEIEITAEEKGRTIDIVCRVIDEYWEKKRGQYEIDVLYTVANKNTYGGSYDDKITVTSKYGAAGFLSIIPSVGQFYKGSVVKGSLILAGEVAAAGGIILCENTRASYIKKMQEQPKHAAEYNSLADSWETGRNVCIGAAAAIYVYNLIDAFAAPGAKRVVVKKGNATLSALPYVDNQSVGIGLALRF